MDSPSVKPEFGDPGIRPLNHDAPDKIASLVESGEKNSEALDATAHRKQFGQFFTPPTIAALACAATIRSTDSSVIDPMCGIGAMLWASWERLSYLGTASEASVTGIEVDPAVASVADQPPDEHLAQTPHSMKIICSDAFAETSGLFARHSLPIHQGTYDAIVGNPPYVRYQSLAPILQETSPHIVQAFRERLPTESDSKLASTIIRSSLIAHLIPNGGHDLRAFANAAVALLRSRATSTSLDPAEACWLKMVAGYSGLADLSLPAWLLTWRLARPGAIIAYVTTSSWRNRQYARFLRYFMLRMLQPLFVLEQEGNTWFEDAQVPTSLMVFRARSPEEAAVPLSERVKSENVVQIVRMRREHNLADPATFRKIARRLGPGLPADNHSGTASCADVIVRNIQEQRRNIDDDLWNVDVVSEQSLVDTLLNEDLASQRSRANGAGLQGLENGGLVGKKRSPVEAADSHRGAQLPQPLRQILGITDLSPDTFRLLGDYEVVVNQGLRTGCNPFFYISSPTDEKLEEAFSCLPIDAAEIANTLEAPDKHPKGFLNLVRRLSTMDALVPDHSPSECPSSRLVELAPEFGSRLAIFPTSCLKSVVRNQRAVNQWSLSASHVPRDYALVTAGKAHPKDYAKLTSYPAYWLDVWKTRDGLATLPSNLSEYISLAAATVLKRNGKLVYIPKLSAVAPNVRRPASATNELLTVDGARVPRAPSWWYTLPIQPRHTGNVFMPRVNDGPPRAYLNSLLDPVLIDANFSTFSTGADSLPAEALFAVLNSMWVKTVLEVMSTPMGGGALKVEANHLRVLPIPWFGEGDTTRLARLGRELSNLPISGGTRIISEINDIVVQPVADALGLHNHRLLSLLDSLGEDLRVRRRVNSRKHIENHLQS